MTAEKQNTTKITNKKVILIAIGLFLLEQIFQLVIQLNPQTGTISIIMQLAYLIFTGILVVNINQFCHKIDQQAGIKQEPTWWLSIGRGLWIIPLTYIVNVVFQSIIMLFLKHYPHTMHTSVNQEAIQSTFQSIHWLYLLTSIVTIVIIAPWCEEFLFRIAIINQPSFSKTKWIYIVRIICSIILFAYMHMMAQATQLFHPGMHGHALALIQLGAYLSISCVLTYMYVRYRSYRTNIAAHTIWNCLTLITMMI